MHAAKVKNFYNFNSKKYILLLSSNKMLFWTAFEFSKDQLILVNVLYNPT